MCTSNRTLLRGFELYVYTRYSLRSKSFKNWGIMRFHWSEIVGGVVGVAVIASVVQPTPVILGLVAFVIGQVVVRTIRNSRRGY